MKFELKPYNHGLTDENLLDDLRAVAQRLNKDFVTKEEYDKVGRLCSSTFQKRFGSWCEAHERAGLSRIRNYQATASDCIEDIKRVAKLLETDCISTADYKTHGHFCVPLIGRRLGSWKKAVLQAGLRVSSHFHETITDEELFEYLERLWEALGRQPTKADFIKPLSRYSYYPYPRRFGTYRKALEAFVSSLDEKPGQPPEELPRVQLGAAPAMIVHKTSRAISWRMRFLVMRRDDFKCRLCGSNLATKPGTVLVVDHIEPWAHGGEAVMENLQTLCEPCNGGKSDLPLQEAHPES